MQKLSILLLIIFAAAGHPARTQPYTLLIKGGFVIDPQSNLQDTLDVAINNGRIVKLAHNIDTRQAKRIIDARGLYVVPGLIDIHTHVFFGADSNREYAGGSEGLIPDSFAFRTGTTTVVDAGSSGWREFGLFRQRVIDHSRTRVLAFLNIVGAGMRGSPYEQDTGDMKAGPAAEMAKHYHKYIVGIKVAHYQGADWRPIDEAVKAGTLAHIPVMVDFGEHIPPLPIKTLFQDHLRPGDIFTHCFAELSDREPIVDPTTKTLKPFVKAARQKGLVFDLGYGEISFAFSQALPAVESGFLPNSLSTDIHAGTGSIDMPDLLSLFLALGLDLKTVIGMATWDPAREIGRKELGHLEQGAIADITMLQLNKGRFDFSDHNGRKITGSQKLECKITVKGGKIVYNR